MRHIKLATLYPWIELVCPVCGEESDHPAYYDDYDDTWNTQSCEPICHCGHVFSIMEIKQRGSLYG